MANFGERLAYWYLRLNGFFLVEDFVLHHEDGAKTADVDLLAVRLKHSREKIAGVDLLPHLPLHQALGRFTDHVGLIVQVKTGPNERRPRRAFNRNRLHRSLRFMGMVPEADIDRVTNTLMSTESWQDDGWLIATMFIADNPDEEQAAVTLRLSDVLSFIEERLSSQSRRKAADRLLFPDELMQFLAWRSAEGDNG